MKAKKLVKTIIFVCIFAFFAVMPIAVLAVIYNSRQSENNFSPAQTDIQIDENGNKGDELLIHLNSATIYTRSTNLLRYTISAIQTAITCV